MIRTRTALAGLAVVAVAATGLATVASADGSGTPTTSPTKQGQAAGPHLLAFYAHTTSDQRVCLAKQGLTAPAGELTAAQRAEVLKAGRAAADACGVQVPKGQPKARFVVGFARLTAEQQACVAKADITRPVGRLTEAQKAQLKADVQAAASACGIN